MLRSLTIRDLAIIDELDVQFGPGLNVLTGETGAGKSIIAGALTLVLGGRAGADAVRSGCARATVDALFDVGASPEAMALVEGLGYDAPDGELLLTREIQDTGKSVARIGGRPATIGNLREVGDRLMDLHGQHEHQSLLSVRHHLDVLDAWGGTELAGTRDSVAELWGRMRDAERRLAGIATDERERLRLADLYRYQIRDIADAKLEPGEDGALSDELLRLRNTERLRQAVHTALQSLHGSDASALGLLASAGRDLDGASAVDPALQASAETVNAARFEIEEAARGLTRYLDELDADPHRLDAVQDRLDRISDLKRKYGPTIEEVLEFGRQAAQSLAAMESSDADAVALQAELDSCRVRFDAQCSALTDLRRAAAQRFAQLVGHELGELAMQRAGFQVSIEPAEPGPSGRDAVEFLLCTNPGEAFRPLARIASGGEISRVMLAIKSAAAATTPLPTMVFDEIDVGIGGRTADVVGHKLRHLARSAQVICITHLPQIAMVADSQYAITKSEASGRTVVRMSRLEPEDRVEELSRMIAGTEITDAAREHVRELLARDRA